MYLKGLMTVHIFLHLLAFQRLSGNEKNWYFFHNKISEKNKEL